MLKSMIFIKISFTYNLTIVLIKNERFYLPFLFTIGHLFLTYFFNKIGFFFLTSYQLIKK